MTLPFSYAKSLNPGKVNKVGVTVAGAAAAAAVIVRENDVFLLYLRHETFFDVVYASETLPPGEGLASVGKTDLPCT